MTPWYWLIDAAVWGWAMGVITVAIVTHRSDRRTHINRRLGIVP